MKNKSYHTQPSPIPISEIGGDKNLTPEARAASRMVNVKPPLPTHAYKGLTPEQRAADRKKANDLK